MHRMRCFVWKEPWKKLNRNTQISWSSQRIKSKKPKRNSMKRPSKLNRIITVTSMLNSKQLTAKKRRLKSKMRGLGQSHSKRLIWKRRSRVWRMKWQSNMIRKFPSLRNSTKTSKSTFSSIYKIIWFK